MSLTLKEYENIKNGIEEIDVQIGELKKAQEKLTQKLETQFKQFENYLKKYENRFAEPIKSLVHFYKDTGEGWVTLYWQVNLRFGDKAYHVTDLPRIEDPEQELFFRWYINQVSSRSHYYHLKLENLKVYVSNVSNKVAN